MQAGNMNTMKTWVEPEGEQGCVDLGLTWGSEQAHGCMHFGLTSLMQQQDAYARRLRKAIIMHGKYGYETLEDVLECIRRDLGDDSVAACVRIGNSHGKTALHIAGWRGNVPEIQTLLNHGASLDAMTSRGHTALFFAVGKQRDTCIEFLLSLGARTKIVTKQKEALVAFAAKCGLQDKTMALLRAAESKDTRQWINFSDMPKSCKRKAMAWTGTLIFMPVHCDPQRLDAEHEDEAEAEREECQVEPEQAASALAHSSTHHAVQLLQRIAEQGEADVRVDPQKLPRALARVLQEAAGMVGAEEALRRVVRVVCAASAKQARGGKKAFRLFASALPRAIRLAQQPEVAQADGLPAVEWRRAVEKEGVLAVVGELWRGEEAELCIAAGRELLGPVREDEERWKWEAGTEELLRQVLAERDAGMCVKVARLLGAERGLGALGVWGALQQERKSQVLEEVGDRVAGARAEIVAAAEAAEAWRGAAKLRRRWGMASERAEERAMLEEMLGKGQLARAAEYAASDPALLALLHQRVPPEAVAPPRNSLHDKPCQQLPSHVVVTWVGDEGAVEALRGRLAELAEGAVVGLDTEWRHPRLSSLLQVGSEEEVALIDMVAAEEDAGMGKAVEALLGWLLCEAPLRCAVYRFKEDLRRLQALYPALLHRRVRFHDCALPPAAASASVKGRGPGPGLAALVEQLLGQPLDKTCQCSNWDRRPLLPEQLQYAALDAWVLLRVYDALRKRGSEVPNSAEAAA